MRYDFEWNVIKAKGNVVKHNVIFEKATTIFRDPHLLSIPDLEHSEAEERWITLGMDAEGNLLVLVHTFEAVGDKVARIRIISARRAAATERQEYERGI